MMNSARQSEPEPDPVPADTVGGEGKQPAVEPAGLPRLIKRYANRKLYDTVEGGFTSLAQIRTLVGEGIEVVVLDHSTGADQTAQTLTGVPQLM